MLTGLVQILLTVAVFIFVIIAFKKGCDTFILFAATIFGLLIWTAVTGLSVLGDAGTGNIFLDVFQYVGDSGSSVIAGNGLLMLVTFGYVELMSQMKATQIFSLLVIHPIKNTKKPYTALGIAMFICFFVVFAIPSATARAGLLIATVYPVLLSLKISKPAAAATIAMASSWHMGPSSHMVATVLNNYTDAWTWSIGEHFTKTELPILIPCMVIIAVLFALWQRRCDRKEENVEYDAGISSMTFGDVGAPKYYGILPILPIILVVVFSDLVTGIVISVIAAELICFLISLALYMIREKGKIVELFNISKALFTGMSKGISVVGIMWGATLFAKLITSIGGISYLIGLINNASGGSTIMIWLSTFVMGIINFITGISTGTTTSTLGAFPPLICELTSSPAQLSKLSMILYSGTVTASAAPVAGTMVATASAANIPITTIIKRNIIPSIGAFLIVSAAVLLTL